MFTIGTWWSALRVGVGLGEGGKAEVGHQWRGKEGRDKTGKMGLNDGDINWVSTYTLCLYVLWALRQICGMVLMWMAALCTIRLRTQNSEFVLVVQSMADGLWETCGALWISIPTQMGFSRYSICRMLSGSRMLPSVVWSAYNVPNMVSTCLAGLSIWRRARCKSIHIFYKHSLIPNYSQIRQYWLHNCSFARRSKGSEVDHDKLRHMVSVLYQHSKTFWEVATQSFNVTAMHMRCDSENAYQKSYCLLSTIMGI